MFDADDDGDYASVCRDEACGLEYVHSSHVYVLGPEPPEALHLQRDPQAYRRPDLRGLIEATKRVFEATQWPLAFRDVQNAVLNDYGEVQPRTLHRHLRRLVNSGFIRDLDLGLPYVAYIRSDSRFLGDPDNLREHLRGRHAASAGARRRAQRWLAEVV